ncbi:MAG: sigma-70 region 2 domain protein, partial [uncultured Corynebacteriales bacterium]
VRPASALRGARRVERHRVAGRRALRADVGLRGALPATRRLRPGSGPAAGRLRRRGRRPGRRGVRQGAGRRPRGWRPGDGVPGVPADDGAAHAVRPDPPGPPARAVRRHDPARPGRAVAGHRGRGAGVAAGGPGVQPAAGAVADRAVAHRGGAGVAGPGRAAARAHAERGGRAGLPGPGGAAAGVPAGAPGRRGRRGAPLDGDPARRLGPRRAVVAAAGAGGRPPGYLRRVPDAGRRGRGRERRPARRRRTPGAGCRRGRLPGLHRRRHGRGGGGGRGRDDRGRHGRRDRRE